MDLSTTYMGLALKNPLVAGASPLTDDLETVRRLEDEGVGAIVMPSLFEEDVDREIALHQDLESLNHAHAEAADYLPAFEDAGHLGPESYVDRLRMIRDAVSVPVIASLNGSSTGGWTRYARHMEEAGADAIELNMYFLSSDPDESSARVEARCVEILSSVTGAVNVPVAVKLSPFFSSLPHFVRHLLSAGAAGLVLFNRFYQPDIDVETLNFVPNLRLSNPETLRLRLRWLAILSGRTGMSLAATGGVHSAIDAVKALMAGASAVQLASSLLINGPVHVSKIHDDMLAWMEEFEYEAVSSMIGSMGHASCPNPAALERANYIRTLESWI